MKIFFHLTTCLFMAACQSNLPAPNLYHWQQPLTPNQQPVIGFGPYPLGAGCLVQSDTQSVGYRDTDSGQLLWSHSLPPDWLNDVWILEEVDIDPTEVTLFGSDQAIVFNEQGGMRNVSYPMSSGEWTTRMGARHHNRWLLPVYDGTGVRVMSSSDDGLSWDSSTVILNDPAHYNIIDGLTLTDTVWYGTRRLWDSNLQKGFTDLIICVHGSQPMLINLGQDGGTGHPVKPSSYGVTILGHHALIQVSHSGQILWSTPLSEPATLASFELFNGAAYVLHQSGQLEVIDLAQGVSTQYHLGSSGMIDRITMGPHGPWVTWGRDVISLALVPQSMSQAKHIIGTTQLSHQITAASAGVVLRNHLNVFCVPN